MTTPSATPDDDSSHRPESDPAEGAVRLPLAALMAAAFTGTMALMSFVAVAGPLAYSFGLEAVHLGVVMSVAGIAWMVMARWWGARSDRLGRRTVLLFGLGGFVASYLALVLFLEASLRFALPALPVFAGLVVGRALMGGFYAAVPTLAAAIVADHAAPRDRARSMAAIGSASAAGMVAGPGLAGMAGEFALLLPLWLTALLPIGAILVLRGSLPRDSAGARPPRAALRLIDRRLRPALAFGFAASASVAVAQVVIGFVAIDRLGFDTQGAAGLAGLALAIVGGVLMAVQTFVRRLDWSPMRLALTGAGVAATGFALAALAGSAMALCAAYGGIACGMALIYPAVPALAANSVDAGEQGAAAGSVATVQGFGIVVGPLIGTAVYGLGPFAPYAMCAIGLAAIAVLFGNRRPAAGRGDGLA